LIGHTLRFDNTIDIRFPSIAWKSLVQEDINISDLKDFDSITGQYLENILHLVELGDKQTFSESIPDLYFTCALSNVEEVELVPGGKSISVNIDNAKEYVKKVVDQRFREFHSQIDHIRAGLHTVIPVDLLSLLTWKELELIVCGEPEVSIEFLKSKTSYESCNA